MNVNLMKNKEDCWILRRMPVSLNMKSNLKKPSLKERIRRKMNLKNEYPEAPRFLKSVDIHRKISK